MKQVRLVGKTKHGKDRIRQHGDVWNGLTDDHKAQAHLH